MIYLFNLLSHAISPSTFTWKGEKRYGYFLGMYFAMIDYQKKTNINHYVSTINNKVQIRLLSKVV